ncbi:MAG: OmpA family protein [Leptospirales bacterium]
MSIALQLNRAFRILPLILLTGTLAACTHQEAAKSLAPGPDQSNQLPGVIVTGHSRTYHPSESTSPSVRIYSTPTAVIPTKPAKPVPLPVPPKKPARRPPAPSLPFKRDIFFAYNSAWISRANKTILVAYSRLLKKNPRYTIRLLGHTDPTGAKKYNRSLALRRALAAKRVLLSQGISIQRIRVYSEGKSPVRFFPRCHKPSCYPKDRAVRIEIVRTTKGGAPSGTSGTRRLKKKKQ